MKKLLCLVLVAACSGKYKAPPSVPQIDLPAGAQLKPYDPAKPGLPRPQALVELNNKVWVTLTNSDPSTYAPAGPGFLAAVVPTTGAVDLVDLGGSGGKACQNPGYLRAAGGKLYVSCSADFSGPGSSLVEVDGTGKVTRIVALTTPPTQVAVSATKVWYGDAMSDMVRSIDLATFQTTTDAIELGCKTGTEGYPYHLVQDLLLEGSDLYALCAADVGGTSTLSRLDPSTGVVRATVNVGPLPVAIASVGDGRIAVLTAGDSKLTMVTPSASGMTAEPAFTFASQTSALQDLRSRNGFLYTVASGSNTVQKLDPHAQGGIQVVGEKNVGAGANPWNILPLDDDQALVTNWVAGNVVSVRW